MTEPGLVAELSIWLGQKLPKRHLKDKCQVFLTHLCINGSPEPADASTEFHLYGPQIIPVYMHFRSLPTQLHEHTVKKVALQGCFVTHS